MPECSYGEKSLSLIQGNTISDTQITNKPTMTSTVMIQTDVGSVEIVTCNEILKKNWLTDKKLHDYFNLLNDQFYYSTKPVSS